MSQVVVCDRCGVNEKFTMCQMCLDQQKAVNLCFDCFGPHYRLQHHIATDPQQEKELIKAGFKKTGNTFGRPSEDNSESGDTFDAMHPSVRSWRPGGPAVKN